MLGDPEPPEPEPLGVPGQIDGRAQRIAGAASVRHRGQVEDRERYLLRAKGEGVVHDLSEQRAEPGSSGRPGWVARLKQTPYGAPSANQPYARN